MKIHENLNGFSDQQLQMQAAPHIKADGNIIDKVTNLESVPLDFSTSTMEKSKKQTSKKETSSNERENFSNNWAADFVPPGMIDVQVCTFNKKIFVKNHLLFYYVTLINHTEQRCAKWSHCRGRNGTA